MLALFPTLWGGRRNEAHLEKGVAKMESHRILWIIVELIDLAVSQAPCTHETFLVI